MKLREVEPGRGPPQEERALRSLGPSWEEEGKERSSGGEGVGGSRERRRDSARVGRRARESRGVVHVAVEEVGVLVESGADGGDVGVEEEIEGAVVVGVAVVVAGVAVERRWLMVARIVVSGAGGG
ncbi:hypothetical protein Syun_004163 [Stephania yunnanensis]|uniref:Uncharacterized protein n=1 Tax=Stephania yunnanensis TaxID=152371 RepID=A0AAP0L2T2_9MAGN